jgi:predicted  nucleic acid-binding Zn ribbon protein
MNDSILELEVENLRELLRLKNINKELLDANHNLLTRLVQECDKNGVILAPEIEALVLRVKQIIREINPNQPKIYKENIHRRFDSTPVDHIFIRCMRK